MCPPAFGNADGEGGHEARPYVLGTHNGCHNIRGTHEGCPYDLRRWGNISRRWGHRRYSVILWIGQEDVVGLEVAVKDTQLVRGVQSARGLLENFCNFGHGQGTTLLQGRRRDSPSRNSMAM